MVSDGDGFVVAIVVMSFFQKVDGSVVCILLPIIVLLLFRGRYKYV